MFNKSTANRKAGRLGGHPARRGIPPPAEKAERVAVPGEFRNGVAGGLTWRRESETLWRRRTCGLAATGAAARLVGAEVHGHVRLKSASAVRTKRRLRKKGLCLGNRVRYAVLIWQQ